MFYIDESGIDKFVFRRNAKAKRGIKVYDKVSGKRFVRQSVISALNYENKLFAPMVYDNTADAVLVIFWVENFLLPALPENSVLIWDNASYHKSKQLAELVESHGHIIKFLPPYSPDLNPIEHKWHEMKLKLCDYNKEATEFVNNLCKVINIMSV